MHICALCGSEVPDNDWGDYEFFCTCGKRYFLACEGCRDRELDYCNDCNPKEEIVGPSLTSFPDHEHGSSLMECQDQASNELLAELIIATKMLDERALLSVLRKILANEGICESIRNNGTVFNFMEVAADHDLAIYWLPLTTTRFFFQDCKVPDFENGLRISRLLEERFRIEQGHVFTWKRKKLTKDEWLLGTFDLYYDAIPKFLSGEIKMKSPHLDCVKGVLTMSRLLHYFTHVGTDRDLIDGLRTRLIEILRLVESRIGPEFNEHVNAIRAYLKKF